MPNAFKEPELVAMRKLARLLEPLEVAQRKRILEWGYSWSVKQAMEEESKDASPSEA